MDEITLRDCLKVLFRQKWVVVASIIAVTAAAALLLWMRTPVYRAQVKMLVSTQKIQGVLTQSEIVKSTPVLSRALKAVGIRSLDYEKQFASPLRAYLVGQGASLTNNEIRKKAINDEQKQDLLFRLALKDIGDRIKVKAVRNTSLFTVSYGDYDPYSAASIANIISRSYVIFDLEQQLSELQIKYGEKNPAVIQLRDSIDKMERGLNGKILPNTEAIGPASVKIMEQAVPPLEPSGLAKPLALALAFLASILLGLILAFIFDYIDQTFKSPQEVEAFLGVSFLGSVPKMARSEAYYKLAEQVYFEMKDKKVKTLLVTSAMPKEGVSTIIAHLAKLMAAKPGCKALAIDANLRRPALHHLFKVPNNAGLVDILEDRSTFDKTVVHMSDKVSVLTAGKPDLNPVTLLESHKMTELLKNVSEKYDVVLIDGANLRETKDTLNLVPHAQGVLIVIDEGKTRKQAVRFEFEPMTDRKMVIGAILNNRTFVIPKAIYERL